MPGRAAARAPAHGRLTRALRTAQGHRLLLALGTALGARLVQEGGGALAAVHAVEVGGHEGTGAAVGALLAQALHLAGVVDLRGRGERAVRVAESGVASLI